MGDFEQGDVLIEDRKVAAVGPSLSTGDALVVDCAGTVVMPGFITTHHHQYETLMRSLIPDGLGTLTPGKEADVVVLDARNINTWPMNNVPGTVVTMMNPRHVRHVLIAGKGVYWNGVLVGWDIERLLRRLEQSHERVLARINGPAKVGALPPGLNSRTRPPIGRTGSATVVSPRHHRGRSLTRCGREPRRRMTGSAGHCRLLNTTTEFDTFGDFDTPAGSGPW